MTSYIESIRKHIGKQKIILVFTSACVVNDLGQVLWQFRSDFSTWGLPGGSVELGENLAECVKREVKEETGLDVEPGRLVGIYSSPDLDVVYPNGDQIQQVTFCFKARQVGGYLHADQAETLRLAWFDAEKPPATFPWYLGMIQEYILHQAASRFQFGTIGKPDPEPGAAAWFQSFAGRQRVITPAVIAFVQDKNGRILLIRQPETGRWELPGGLMLPGERLDNAAIRVAQPAAGAVMRAAGLLAVGSGNKFDLTLSNGNMLNLVVSLFRCELITEPIPINSPGDPTTAYFAASNLPLLKSGEEHWIKIGLENSPLAKICQ